MSRRELREHLFRMLFRKDFHSREELMEQLDFYIDSMETYDESDREGSNMELESLKEADKEYLTDKYVKIIEKTSQIDFMINEVSSGWKLNRMGKADLCILRLAVYEMKFDEEIPVKVAINEAVEIAKKYGEDQSPGFVNGILAKLAED